MFGVRFTEGLWLWWALRPSASTKGLTTDCTVRVTVTRLLFMLFLSPYSHPLSFHSSIRSTLSVYPHLSLPLISLSPCTHSSHPKEEIIKVYVPYTEHCDYQSSVNCLPVSWWSTEHIRTRPRRLRNRRRYKKTRNVPTFILTKRTERRSCSGKAGGGRGSQKKMQNHELFSEMKQKGISYLCLWRGKNWASGGGGLSVIIQRKRHK